MTAASKRNSYSAAMTRRPTTAMLALLLCAAATHAQVKIADPTGPAPVKVTAPGGTPAAQPPRAMSPDEEAMASARRALAEDKPSRALSLLNDWIDRHEKDVQLSPYRAEAFYLRGNAKLAMGNEFASLYDYEEVIKNHPESEQFVPCLERELQVARLYLNGRKKPSNLFGLRLDSGKPLAEEIILRICERLPGSRLAERSILELADYYARARDLELAAETYDVFLRLYPRSDQRSLAMQRRVYANIARFKGPGYDAAALKDAMVQIEEFQEEFPAEAQRTGVSDALMARVDESAAAGLLKNARWYLRKEDTVSARLTLTRLIKRHPRTGAAQQAVAMIQEIDTVSATAPVEQEP